MKLQTSTSLRIIYLALVGALMLSCKEQAPKVQPAAAPAASAASEQAQEAGIAFREASAQGAFTSYLALKDALVASDASAAAAAAKEMQGHLSAAEGELATALTSLANTADLNVQRSLFSDLGAALEPVFQEHLSSGTVYKQFCPMAFNNQGGYWFSDSETIRNPYFGDAMLSCGKVDTALKAL